MQWKSMLIATVLMTATLTIAAPASADHRTYCEDSSNGECFTAPHADEVIQDIYERFCGNQAVDECVFGDGGNDDEPEPFEDVPYLN